MFNYIDPLLQIVVGIFFAVTGYRKLFVRATHGQVWSLFERLHVPRAARWLVIAGEFAGGLGLLFGVLSWWAALGLLPILIGAYTMDTIPSIRAKSTDKRMGWTWWVSKMLCTPEAMLILIAADLVVVGALA